MESDKRYFLSISFTLRRATAPGSEMVLISDGVNVKYVKTRGGCELST